MPSEPTIDPELEVAFVSGQGRPSWPELIAGFTAASEAIATRPGVLLDLPYGPHPRQTFDLVPADGLSRGVLIYLHPGYWQMRDKATFRFLGATFAALGFDTLFANYPLAPDRGVGEITEAVRAIVPAALAPAMGRPIVAAGHSAGAHLAVELALTDPSAWGLGASPIAGVLALSGVYDLEPLIATSLDGKLALTPETARAASPLHRTAGARCPALFAVGGGETSVFRDQNRAMAEAWRDAGAAAELREEGEEDHFSLIARLAEPASPLHAAVAEFLARVGG